MVRAPEVGDPANENEQSRDFAAIVVTRSVPRMKTRGFEVTDCAAVRLEQVSDIQVYRDRVCTLASKGNEAVQNQFEKALGERPSVLCANAELIAGRWSHGQSG